MNEKINYPRLITYIGIVSMICVIVFLVAKYIVYSALV